MLKLKTKWLNKWAKKNSISDKVLLQSIDNLESNLGITDLGSGLYKVRIAKEGRGKSGGFRSLLVYNKEEIAIFVYGFSKSEQENMTVEELKLYKKTSKKILSFSKDETIKMINSGEFIIIKTED